MNKALMQAALPELRPALPADSETMQVLQLIEAGRITTAEGVRLLDALHSPQALAPAGVPPTPSLVGWPRWWLWPMTVGGLTALMGTSMAVAAFGAGGLGLGFIAATLLAGFGLALVGLGIVGRSVRWLHLRVRLDPYTNRWPQNIAISCPLPLRLTAGLLRVFGPLVPQLKDHGWDELILALAETTSGDNPLYVEVDEGWGGERVQLFIG